MRRRLVGYFARKRCLSPDDLSDETLNRVARRLEEEGTISDASPPRYCYIVAKFVFLEYLRRGEHRRESLDRLKGPSQSMSPRGGAMDDEERRLECLERCLRQLGTVDRELILEYDRRFTIGLTVQEKADLAAFLRAL